MGGGAGPVLRSSGGNKNFGKGRLPERARCKLGAMSARPRAGRGLVRVELNFGGSI
jgi:hypothetical protein